jgi:hypothetical protein
LTTYTDVVDELLAQYPLLPRRPFLWGGATKMPKVAIVLPYTVWQGISATNKSRLKLHMVAWIDRVRQDPMAYGSVPRTAPIAPVIETNASNMNARSWCVMVGTVVDGGRDATLDQVVLAGDSDD